MKDSYVALKNETMVREANKSKTLFEENLTKEIEPLSNGLFKERIIKIRKSINETILKESLLVNFFLK